MKKKVPNRNSRKKQPVQIATLESRFQPDELRETIVRKIGKMHVKDREQLMKDLDASLGAARIHIWGRLQEITSMPDAVQNITATELGMLCRYLKFNKPELLEPILQFLVSGGYLDDNTVAA